MQLHGTRASQIPNVVAVAASLGPQDASHHIRNVGVVPCRAPVAKLADWLIRQQPPRDARKPYRRADEQHERQADAADKGQRKPLVDRGHDGERGQRAEEAGDGGQFNKVLQGVDYSRVGGYSPPPATGNGPGTGQGSYSGK